MPALERLGGIRVVADPGAIDRATWARDGHDVVVLRFAPDEVFAIGAIHAAGLTVDDPHAIVVEETGFVGAWCDPTDLAAHAEWPVPLEGPALAQGAVAGVPVKVWRPPPADAGAGDDRVLLVVAAAHADDLRARLGWDR